VDTGDLDSSLDKHWTDDSRETLRMYYTVQYARATQHETLRIQVSNYVVGSSVVAMGLVATIGDAGRFVRLAVALALVAINGLAILYVRRSRYWANLHLARVRATLRELSPELFALQETTDACEGKRAIDAHFEHGYVLQSYIHVVLACVAMAIGLLD
jgi:hypothetical protein